MYSTLCVGVCVRVSEGIVSVRKCNSRHWIEGESVKEREREREAFVCNLNWNENK